MEDGRILDLYWARNEDAIHQTEIAYGAKLNRLAVRIVENREDAQECVSDTYLKAWDTIPPQRPTYLFAYLAKICRFCAFAVLDWRNAEKRRGNVVTLTEEMELCIPDPAWDEHFRGEELGEILNRFLAGLSRESRGLFLRRYWYMDSIEEIARRYGMTPGGVKTRLHRIRGKLRSFLQQEGISV